MTICQKNVPHRHIRTVCSPEVLDTNSLYSYNNPTSHRTVLHDDMLPRISMRRRHGRSGLLRVLRVGRGHAGHGREGRGRGAGHSRRLRQMLQVINKWKTIFYLQYFTTTCLRLQSVSAATLCPSCKLVLCESCRIPTQVSIHNQSCFSTFTKYSARCCIIAICNVRSYCTLLTTPFHALRSPKPQLSWEKFTSVPSPHNPLQFNFRWEPPSSLYPLNNAHSIPAQSIRERSNQFQFT